MMASPVASLVASMGPRFNGVEDPYENESVRRVANASMGPRFNGVEDRENDVSTGPMWHGFNGATL